MTTCAACSLSLTYAVLQFFVTSGRLSEADVYVFKLEGVGSLAQYFFGAGVTIRAIAFVSAWFRNADKDHLLQKQSVGLRALRHNEVV